jgi:hypothetical protein
LFEGKKVILTWEDSERHRKLIKVYDVVDERGGTYLVGYVIGERVLNISRSQVIEIEKVEE